MDTVGNSVGSKDGDDVSPSVEYIDGVPVDSKVGVSVGDVVDMSDSVSISVGAASVGNAVGTDTVG